MKGVSGIVVLSIASLVIVALFLTMSGKATSDIFEDKRAQTYIAAMGLRNSVIQLSLAERGTAQFAMPKKEVYDVVIDSEKISVQYAGAVLAAFKPNVEISHYTPALVSKTLNGAEFCIVNRKDPLAGCAQVIDVCKVGDATCPCTVDTSVC